MKSLVSSSNLVAYRKGKPLFAPFTIEMRKGDIAVIRGRNGVGKSTLLNCLSRQYFDLTGYRECSGTVSYLPQGQHHPQTVCLLEIAPLVIGYTQHRYQNLLDLLGIRSCIETRLPSLLSGGELQRVRLLLAMLRSHEVLFLDEPFANLDESSRKRISEELIQSRSCRATMLISHQIEGHLHFGGVRECELRPAHN